MTFSMTYTRKSLMGVFGFRRFPEILSTSIRYGLKEQTILLILLANLAFAFGLAGLEQFWQPQVMDILGGESRTWIFGVLATGYFLAASEGAPLHTSQFALSFPADRRTAGKSGARLPIKKVLHFHGLVRRRRRRDRRERGVSASAPSGG